MRQRKWRAALSTLMIAAALGLAQASAAPEGQKEGTAEGHDCSDIPAEAVMSLQPPLDKWGRIVCTPMGQMLGSNTGWVWILPNELKPVLVPSHSIGEESGAKTYFTKIEVRPSSGEEFEAAYKVFHEGFDEKEEKPVGYRVDLTSSTGRSLTMFFFDYDTYAWAIACPGNECIAETRFVILDMSAAPNSREKLARANSI